jgi:membrane-bound lytic murein transglycosylase D
MARFRICSILFSLLAVVSPLAAQDVATPFTSKGLESRVDFWKKIFTEYGKDDYVIHDSFYVNLIYGKATSDDVKSRMTAIKDALKEIRATLSSPETRSPFAQEIAATITAQGLPISDVSVDTLIDNLHTQLGVKERFRDGVVRSGRYVEEFRKIIKDAGVPEDLALLPLVESSFENARSKANALGIWQFTRSTGRQYLTINNKVDERLDPTKAATAAAHMLSDNFKALGEWPLAVTAYNHGRPGMMKAKSLHGSDLATIINDYRGPVFGYASMNFYASFLAAVDVYKTYPQYFGDLVLEQPNTPKAPTVKLAATTVKPAAPPAPAAKALADKYKVRTGDTLSVVAQRFGTSIRSLMELNHLKQSVIYAGQILLVK